jgi:RNA polymerase sigma-70 factor (ECF subfamily)
MPVSDADDRRMVEAAQRDPARFVDLYRAHFERVYGYVARHVSVRDQAEDLTSDVFHKALAALPRYEWRGVPFGVWLLRIASNVLADQSKRGAREVVGMEGAPEPAVHPNMDGLEDRARLFRLVSRLPDEQRHVIRERFVEQRSVREIAQQLGRSEGAVKQLQYRALRSLREQMEGGDA